MSHDIFGYNHFLHLFIDSLIVLQGLAVVILIHLGVFIELLYLFLHFFYCCSL